MGRRKFDKQFKNSAVKLILEEGYSVKEVSQELEVLAILSFILAMIVGIIFGLFSVSFQTQNVQSF